MQLYFFNTPLRMTERSVMYVDGYNFYYDIQERHPPNLLYLGWCNFVELAQKFMLPQGAALTAVKYFTAPVGTFGKPGGHAGSEAARQAIWLKAVQSVGIEVVEGVHAYEPHAGKKRVEKQTDVNIAVGMVGDAALDVYDRALLVTADQDQMPTVKATAGRFKKSVDIWLPPSFHVGMWKVTEAYGRVSVRRIKLDMLRESRLPETIEWDGSVVKAPSIWRAPRT